VSRAQAVPLSPLDTADQVPRERVGLRGGLLAGPRRGTPLPLAIAVNLLMLLGAGGVAWSAYLHLHLWATVGYRHLHTIGPLFLAQWIGGFALAALIVLFRRVWVAVLGIGFGITTIVGFLLTVYLPKGLFNFNEVWTAPYAQLAFGVEVALAAVLFVAAALCLVASSSARTGSAPVAPTGA
jgi:hypothetical protein